MYSRSFLGAFAQEHNASVADQLPPSLQHACFAQLQHHNANKCPDVSTIQAWADRHGVVCLTATCSFYTKANSVDEMRGGLKPSDAYKHQTQAILSVFRSYYNASSFIGVHVRTEGDFEHACKVWPIRGGKICWASEVDITKFLLARHNAGSIIMVLSGAPISKLPSLCATFTCVARRSLISNTNLVPQVSTSMTSIAYLDFLLALTAEAFYGNYYSSFSQEVVAEFAAIGKGGNALYYNALV
jgi:hypothetical protein